MIRHMLLGVASAAALSLAIPAAQAADLPAYEPAPAVAAVPSFSWTGPYIGAQAGYGWGRASNMKNDGGMVGGYVGINYQLGDGQGAIIGVETDLNYADIDGKKSRRGFRTGLNSDYNGAVRGRVGYAFGRFLAYGAAGFAYSDREFRRFGDKDSTTAYGYTVGGGIEAAVTDNVAVRAEYRYNDYGKDKFNVGGVKYKSDYTEHRVMGGVAVKFNSPF